MENRTDYTLNGLAAASVKAIGGAKAHGVTIGLVLNTEALLVADAGAYEAATRLCEEARVELVKKQAELTALIADAHEFATDARDGFKRIYGYQFNPNFRLLGFKSFRIPRSVEDLLAVVVATHGQLTLHPEHENPQNEFTAAAADVLREKLEEALPARNNQKALKGIKLKARNAAAAQLRKRMRGLINELSQLINPLDDRWVAFGFNKPGAQAVPEVPENVVATVIPGNQAMVTWDAAPRAEYYRVFKRVLGVDAELIAVGNPADLDFLLEGLPANSQVEIAVTAVNNGGESLPSATVTVTLP